MSAPKGTTHNYQCTYVVGEHIFSAYQYAIHYLWLNNNTFNRFLTNRLSKMVFFQAKENCRTELFATP